MFGFSRLPLLVLLTSSFVVSGCSLICSDFEGNVIVEDIEVNETDNFYSETVTVDPNDFEDYRDNRDRIENGEILSIRVIFDDVPARNRAVYLVGQIDVKPAGAPESEFITAVAEWNDGSGGEKPVLVVENNFFEPDLKPTAKGQVDDIIFGGGGAIDLRIVGFAYTAPTDDDPPNVDLETLPVNFTVDIDVELGFSSCL